MPARRVNLQTGGLPMFSFSKLVSGNWLRSCPSCESRAVFRSHRRGVLGLPLIRKLGLTFYRCTDCWHRFVRPNAVREHRPSPAE